MKDFIAAADAPWLRAHGLDSFEALWARPLEPVDEPNTGRGGESSVCLLSLESGARAQRYYLKRQRGHLTRSLRHPFGEPTFAREWRSIQRFERAGIATLDVAFFAQRGRGRNSRAVLLTRALDGFRDLASFLPAWLDLPQTTRAAIVQACAALIRHVHACGLRHGCLYPKHIFLREVLPASSGGWQTRLIDLEKARRLLPGRHDRLRDLEPLLRRASVWLEAEARAFLRAYLSDTGNASLLEDWWQRLTARQRNKAQR